MPSAFENDLLEQLQKVTAREIPAAPEDRITVTRPDAPAPDGIVSAALHAVTRSNLWEHPDAHPVVLDVLLLHKYGPDWLGWEPETLQARVPKDFGVRSLSDLNLSKLQACRTMHLVDGFWQRWEVFIVCAMPLNGEFPDFETMQVPTAAQCLVACDIANRIRDDMPYSDEMKAYVGAVYRHDDIFLPLPPTEFAVLDVPEAVDAVELKKRWLEAHADNKAPTAQTIMDEQLRRLFTINTFLEESRRRLHDQLAMETR